jgi:hypothetical protein
VCEPVARALPQHVSGPLGGRNGSILAAALAAAVVSGAHGADAQPRDPELEWRTLDTPHFTIHYHVPLGYLARRVGTVAERAHATLTEVMGYEHPHRTHIVLTDESDSANGSAIAIPYNQITLFATAPPSMSPLNDYDDWLNLLVHHEHTHITHLDQWSGIASFINLLLGKVYAPNHVQPRWFLEGVATWQESERTAGGRLRSTMFDMYLRMDALEGRFWDIDQLSNIADRWPHGNAWYLYGSQFVEYIASRFGREAIAHIARAYGDSTIPWGLNRVARRATGMSFIELYSEFQGDRRRHYEAQRDRVIAAGLREGERITFHGENARLPRFLPDGSVAYWRADGRWQPRIMAFALDRPNEQRPLARVAGEPGLSMHPSGHVLYYSRPDNYRDIYFFHDLFRHDLETGRIDRLTHGARAREPDISADGRKVAFTMNEAGTTHLAIAELRDVEGTTRILLRNDRFDQVFDPRFSPDGRTLAVSRWQRGGYRDIQLIDVASGRVAALTHDRAQDTSPTWSADGRRIYFSSDRTGIANVYVYELASGEIRQLTNVIAGAYQPAVSPDERHLVYVGYTSYGFDLFHLELDPSEARPAPRYVDDRPPPVADDEIWPEPSREYQPLETLYPRAYMIDVAADSFGTALGITVDGRDLAGWHQWRARATAGLARGTLNVDLDYEYRRSPLTVGVHLYRREGRRNDLFIEGANRDWIENALGGELRLAYSMPGTFHGQAVSLTYSGWYSENMEPFGGELDPNHPPPSYPRLGYDSRLRLGWSFSNVDRFTYDISPSFGTALGVSISAGHPILGSPYKVVTLSWSLRHYQAMPWGEQHVLALFYGGGMSEGDPGHRDSFGVGGFGDTSFLDALLSGAIVGGIALRGYPVNVRSGRHYHLLQLEYRFPIWRINRGILTLPVYLNRLHAAVFVDTGNAFNGPLDLSQFLVGAGGHLMLDFTIGYLLAFTLRVGYARGLMEGGMDQVYGHIGVPF